METTPEYAVYKGETLICIGTKYECAEELDVTAETIRFYAKPHYKKRVDKRIAWRIQQGKPVKDYVIAIRLEEGDD
jgi:hypothetical protein